jgi:hypothetical protein
MYNAPQPRREDLPTRSQLRRWTTFAVVGAVAIGVMVYMPAELGRDPTGVGSVLGLKEMGEIKQQLAEEAAADALLHESEQTSSLFDRALGLFISKSHAQEVWQDKITFTLAPGEFTEVKATMEKGATLFYTWVADGGHINFDLHAHGDGNNVTYEKGRGQTSGEGSFEAAFDGDHGWFWRNRDDAVITVNLQLRGDYSAIVRSE